MSEDDDDILPDELKENGIDLATIEPMKRGAYEFPKETLGKFRVGSLLAAKLDRIDRAMVEDSGILSPSGLCDALVSMEIDTAKAKGEEINREEAVKRSNERQLRWVVQIASGKPSKYAPKRMIRPNERLKAIALLHTITGAGVRLKLAAQDGTPQAPTNVTNVLQIIQQEQLRQGAPKRGPGRPRKVPAQ